MDTFILAERLDVITIPNKAVQMVDKKQIVEVVTKEGNVEVRKIKTGLTDGSQVEVVEGLKVGEEVMDLIVDLNKRGNTIIIITHDNEIAKKASRVINIRDGEIS